MSSKLIEAIKKAETIAISGHINPDGDCVGSTSGLYHYILANFPEKKVFYFLQDPAEGIKAVIDMPQTAAYADYQETVFDLFISLDSSTEDRLGDAAPIFDNAKFRFVVDHHKTNIGFGDENVIVADASSACEVLFDLLDEDKINLNCAKSLYLGIVHDTGVFKYSLTSGHTMEIAGKLMDMGIDTAYTIDRSFYEKSWKQTKLFARALDKACLAANGRLSYTVIDKKDLDEFDCTKMDTDGIVEQLRLVNTVEVAMFIRQDGENLYKVSLRAKTGIVDVSEISVMYNGGGHKMAAGFSVEGDIAEIVPTLVEEITKRF